MPPYMKIIKPEIYACRQVGDKLLEVDGRPVGGVMVQELARCVGLDLLS